MTPAYMDIEYALVRGLRSTVIYDNEMAPSNSPIALFLLSNAPLSLVSVM